MWSDRVLGPDVFGDHRLQMTVGDDEEMIKAVLSNGPHPPRGESVRRSRQIGRLTRGSGKQERLQPLHKRAFLSEATHQGISSLEELNDLFFAWPNRWPTARVHAATR